MPSQPRRNDGFSRQRLVNHAEENSASAASFPFFSRWPELTNGRLKMTYSTTNLGVMLCPGEPRFPGWFERGA